MSLILNKQQKTIINEIITMLNRGGYTNRLRDYQLFTTTVGGYAGTGKTTLICELRKEIYKNFPNLSVAFVTFTGKASSVLQEKMERFGVVYPGDYVGTIHRLIYQPEVKWDNTLKTHVIVGWKLKPEDEMLEDLIIIDEASMVSLDIWKDLIKFQKSIIAVGDHGQLPPIGNSFNLLKHSEFYLTEIHRQALNSPIIALSKFVREEGYVPFNKFFSKEVFKLSWDHPVCKSIWENKITFDEKLIILCGFNTTRAYLNDLVRERLGYKELVPYPNERIVCLVNNYSTKIMNGQIGTVLWVMPEDKNLCRITIDIETSQPIECMVSKKCFGEVTYTMYDRSKKSMRQREYANTKGLVNVDFFDYGYAMSVHKSQGSEWDKVILFEQRSQHWDDKYYARWLYTAITRSKEKLFIISDFYG